MANRQFHHADTQGARHCDIPFVILPQGASAPLLSEGDPNGSFVSVVRTGTGAFTITSKDPYVALVNWDACVMANAQGNWSTSFGAPTQNANQTWSIPFTIYLAGTATDLAANANNRIACWLRFRNTNVLP